MFAVTVSGGILSVLASFALGSLNAPAQATGSPAVRTSSCSSIPALVNGGFEDFSNPDNGGVANNKPTQNGYGWWHGYGYGGPEPGPDQILFLKSGDPSVPSNYVTGWRTTDVNFMVEIQRQVNTYTSSTSDVGVSYGPYSPSRSGVATPTTSLESNYWDRYGPQPAQGSYWAELNALTNSALYQDINVTSGDQMFWSVKHRGRTDTNEEMKVEIGPVGSLVQQTTIYKYAPTNADKFVGYPTYDSTYSAVSRMITPLNSGWNRYEGAYTAGASGVLRFQFGAVQGGPFGPSFGNLLDDIQFTMFIACPAARTLEVGQTVSIDVSQAPLSYGIRQTLSGVSNSTAPAGEVQTSGNTVTFTPTAAGTYTADYTVQMNFGGTIYSKTAQLTYTVTAPPTPTPSPTPTKQPQVPNVKIELPNSVEPMTPVVIVPHAIETNAGQTVQVRVRCSPVATRFLSAGDLRLCRVVRSDRGRVTVTVVGRAPTRLSVKLHAGAVENFTAYEASKVYRVPRA